MLVPRNIPVVDQVVIRSIQLAVDAHIRRHHLPKSDRDDLVQEVALHLIQQSSGFNPLVGAWSTYVKCVVKSKLASLRRAARSARHGRHGNTKSLNQKARDLDGRASEFGDLVPEGASPACKSRQLRPATRLSDMNCDVNSVVRTLAPELRILCETLMEEPNISEASLSLEVSRSTTYRRIETIRQTMVYHEFHQYL